MGRTKAPTQQDIELEAWENLLAKHGGALSPPDIVEAAKAPEHPFHCKFDWDDTSAGARFRLIQASQLLRAWRGTVMRIDTERRMVRFEAQRRVQSPMSGRGRAQASYLTVEEIMADPVKRDDMMRTVLRELLAYRNRYAKLNALAEVWFAIDTAIELHGADLGLNARTPPTDQPPAN